MPSCDEHAHGERTSSSPPVRARADSLAVAAAWPAGALAQGADRDLYAAARALEQHCAPVPRRPGAQAETSLDDVHTAVAAYLLVPKRFPASAYSDDALWQAGQLSLDAFARFGRTRDRMPASAC